MIDTFHDARRAYAFASGINGREQPLRILANDATFRLIAPLCGAITVISPDGRHIEHHPMPDPMTTNICFGGPDMKTAYITLSWTGRLVAVDWPTPGLKLNQAG